jgi:hypothetical protein
MASCVITAVVAGALVCACGGRPAGAPARPRAGPSPRAEDPLSAAALMVDVRWLVDEARAGRGSFQPGARVTADYLASEFARIGLEVVRQPVVGGAENVIGIRRAGARAVLVSAHYDHLGRDARWVLYPGADDNASGTAVLLGLARKAAGRRFAHTLLFVGFGAEETGLQGSGAYVRAPVWPLPDTAAIINFDMVGRHFNESGVAQPDTAAAIGLERNPDAARAAAAAARRVGLKLIAAPANLVDALGFSDRTDDWWFRRRGLFCVHFSTGLHRDYHQPTDTAERLVPAQMERVARTAYALLEFLATAPDSGVDSQGGDARGAVPPVR